jgi:hypothetical protein
MVMKRKMELKWNEFDLLKYISVPKNVMSKIIEMLNLNSRLLDWDSKAGTPPPQI